MAAKVKAKAPPKPVVEIFDNIEQRSAEWFDVRRGIITASNFAIMMRSGKDSDESKTRRDLLYALAGEQLTGVPAEDGYKSAAMQRGNDMEPEAREHYARTNFATLRRVAFIRRTLPNGIVIGCSPDSLVGDDGALEIKTMAPHLMIAHLVNGAGPPPKHRPQLQGTMWVADLAWVDLLLFYRNMPVSPKWRIERDDVYIKELSEAVEVFDWELTQLVRKIKSMGGK